jgi:hypothetical protein
MTIEVYSDSGFFDDDEELEAPTYSKAVKLNPYKPREFKSYELMTDEEIVAGKGGYLAFDIEVYSNYFLIAFRCINSQKVIIFEKSLPSGLSFDVRMLYWVMHNYTVVGFNSLKFDAPLLWYAHSQASLGELKELTRQLIFDGLRTSEFERGYGIKIPKTSHIDLMEVCPLKGGLKTYGARLHCERLQDLPFDPDSELDDEQIRIVRDYCINDLDTTILLFNNLLEQLKLRDELSLQYRENLMSKSDAQIAESVIAAELKRMTGSDVPRAKIEPGRIFHYKVPTWMTFKTSLMQGVLDVVSSADYVVTGNGRVEIPEAITKLKINIGSSTYRMGNGGLHSSEKVVSHVGNSDLLLIDRDVASYYPAIVLNLGLFPEHLGTNFLCVYRTLVERRLAAKSAKQSAVADALKITINGAFGKLGSPHSVLYAPNLMIQVTLTGQLSLLMLIEALELEGVPIVSANTDGIVMKCPQDRQGAALSVIEAWEAATGFVTEETRYTAVYSRDVNAYIAVKEDGSCKGKNAYFDPWSGGAKAAIFRFHKNPRSTICIEAVNDFLTKAQPIEQTIRECRAIQKFVCVQNVAGGAHKDGDYLGKVVRWYYAKGNVGTINKAINNNTVPESEGAKPLMDLPDTLPIDIDFDWYIRKANQMLIDIGHTKPPSEISFFD